jgi:hypothetical protein
MSLRIGDREITKILVVDDEKAGRESYGLTVEEVDVETILQEEKTESVDKFFMKLNAQDAVVSDYHLRRTSSYFPMNGAELVSGCYDRHIPSVLLTRYEKPYIHEIRPFRNKIPVMLPPDEFTPDTLRWALTECVNEFNGHVSVNRKTWRTLVRIDQVDEASVLVFVPSWNSSEAIELRKAELPQELLVSLKPDLRIFAKVNIEAENVFELFFTNWEF